jgi:hypothetical protein
MPEKASSLQAYMSDGSPVFSVAEGVLKMMPLPEFL